MKKIILMIIFLVGVSFAQNSHYQPEYYGTLTITTGNNISTPANFGDLLGVNLIVPSGYDLGKIYFRVYDRVSKTFLPLYDQYGIRFYINLTTVPTEDILIALPPYLMSKKRSLVIETENNATSDITFRFQYGR